LLDSPRAGDVVVFARRGWSFHPSHASDHGGPLEDEILVPVVVAGCGIGHGELPVVRQVDVLPTVLEFLGRRGPVEGLDGRSFLKHVEAVELSRALPGRAGEQVNR
jgi:hypothetical protein